MNPYIPLAKAIEAVFIQIDQYIEKVSAYMCIPRLCFYEKILLNGRPLMSHRELDSMMNTYVLGLRVLSPNPIFRVPELSILLAVLQPPAMRFLSDWTLKYGHYFIPWGVKTDSLQDNRRLVGQGRDEAIVYCPSEAERAEEIGWFEEEKKYSTFTNQFLSVVEHQKEQAVLSKQLSSPAFPIFKPFVEKYYKKYEQKTIVFPEDLPGVAQSNFAPREDVSIHQAYKAVVKSISSRKQRNYEPLKLEWRALLERSIFIGLSWGIEKRESVLKQLLSEEAQSKGGPRWESGLSLDVSIYAAFIRYFAHQFLSSPDKNSHFGQIVCLLWIAIRGAEQSIPITLASLLSLKVVDVNFDQNVICLPGRGEIDISQGLSQVLSTCPARDDNKFFPSLTEDRLEDIFRRASAELLPNRPAALPSAFLIFPGVPGRRVSRKMRKSEREHPPKLHHEGPSRHEILKLLKRRKS